jgi:RNA polymerase sigma-70 factor (ECF subfamily)
LGGDHREYEDLIGPIEDRMIRSVWRIARDADDADDAFQQALETIWKRLDRIRRHPNPRALILRICVNAAYDVLRKRARQQRREAPEAIPDEQPDTSPSAADRIAAREDHSEILSAISRLPRSQAQAVLMRFVQELPYCEIAQALGCSEATARRHIANARVRLRKMLGHLAAYGSKEVRES